MGMFSRFRFRNYNARTANVMVVALNGDGAFLGAEATPIASLGIQDLLDPETSLEDVKQLLFTVQIEGDPATYHAELVAGEEDEDFRSGEGIIVTIPDPDSAGFVSAVTYDPLVSKTDFLEEDAEKKKRRHPWPKRT